MEFFLESKHTGDAAVIKSPSAWRLEISAGQKSGYQLAQLDDYSVLPRKEFRNAPPWSIGLDARASAAGLPGTWGFGLWNDPFGFAVGFGGSVRRLPCLPNAAWFFHASRPNWLSLQDDLPGDGFFAGTIRSAHIPSLLLAPALLGLPLLAVPPLSRLLRRLAAHFVRQDAAPIPATVSDWHHYSFEWSQGTVEFKVDGEPVLKTDISPLQPLGLVIWIDNQYASWDPSGHVGYGTLGTLAGWLEIANIQSGL
jgi:hypothetical protein